MGHKELRQTLECGARLSDERLDSLKNEFGNFNLRGPCIGRDFWANADEIASVRSGTFKMEPVWEPFSAYRTLSTGLVAFLAAAALTLTTLGVAVIGSWVWGQR